MEIREERWLEKQGLQDRWVVWGGGGGGGRRTVRWAAEASTQGKGEGRKIIPILLKLTTVKVSVTSFKLLKK